MAENEKILNEDEKTEKIEGGTTTTKRKSIMQVNPDGSTTITDAQIYASSSANERP